MTIRKNFTMSEYVVENLEFLAKTMHKKQSQAIQELIQDKMRAFEKEKKIQALEKISGIFTGELSDEISIQKIKADSFGYALKEEKSNLTTFLGSIWEFCKKSNTNRHNRSGT